MPKHYTETSYFNENYVLFHILNSSEFFLQNEIMRIYKHHSPLPLITRKMGGNLLDLSASHYWISNKSMSIVSMDLFSAVQGKSTFLNEIFRTDFELSEGRHPICSKTANIQYNIYRN